MKMVKNKFIYTILALALISVLGYFFGWFGPTNFDECVRSSVKDAKTETAARLLTQACRREFPARSKEAAYEISPDQVITHIFMGFEHQNDSTIKLIRNLDIVNVKIKKNNSLGATDNNKAVEIKVKNNNAFNISSLNIGLMKADQACSWRRQDYSEIVFCQGNVKAGQEAIFRCESSINTNELNFCLVGFGVDSSGRTINKFMSDNGLKSNN